MAFLLALFFVPLSFAAITIDEKVVNQLIGENPDVQVLRDRLSAAEHLKGSLGRSFLPKVGLAYGREVYTTGPYRQVNQPFGGIEAKINVYNSGRDQVENEKREKQAAIARIDAAMARSLTASELMKAMSHYAYLKEVHVIINDALSLNEQNLKNAQKRINAGISTQTDLLDFKQQVVSLNQEIKTLDYELAVSQRLILTLVGHPSEEAVEVVFVNSHPEHDQKETSLPQASNSYILKKANLEKDIALLEKSHARKWWTPSVDIYSYALRFTQKEREYADKDDRNDYAIGFKITVPIFDGGEGIKFAQAKDSIAHSAEAQAHSRQLEINRQSQDATHKLQLAHTLIHGAEESVALMSDYRKGVLSEYTRGIKNSPDVLQASLRWIEAKTKFAEVKKNYQFAKADALYLSSLSSR